MPDKKNRGISNRPIAIQDVPDSPTVTATDVGTSRTYNNGAATVNISSPTGGLPTSYSITTTPTTSTTAGVAGANTITGLAAATSYTVSVTATNGTGVTTAATTTSSFTATTVPQNPTIGSPTVATGQAYTGNANVSVPFTAGATGGSAISSYTVTSSSGNSNTGASSPILVSDVVGTARTYTVTATNANGTSTASSASASTTPSSVPQAPTIGTVTDGGTGTTVSIPYTANATGGSAITNYQFISSPATTTQTSTSNPYTFTGLTAGTAYTFTVAAINANGTSSASDASNSVTPVVPTAYSSIATVTAAGGESSLSFTSIPSGYTDLQIRAIVKNQFNGDGTYSTRLQFNSDTGNNYVYHGLYGNGTSAAANGVTASPSLDIQNSSSGSGASSGTIYGTLIIDIADYLNTSKNKTVKAIAGNDINVSATNKYVGLYSGLWLSTSAITRIDILPQSIPTTWAAGTTFALYGVKASA